MPILLDDDSEEAEQFSANLTLVNNNGISVTVDPAMATINITDAGNSEPLLLQFERVRERKRRRQREGKHRRSSR